MVEADCPSLREWRQGSVLPLSASQALNLLPRSEEETHCAVVVSHDCDIANALQEPDVEVVVGQFVSSANGNFTAGKNSRKLHLDWHHEGSVCHIELSANAKRRVPKCALAEVLPNDSYMLDEKNLATLRFWLGARYNRAAFPDEFNNRLRSTKLGDDIVKILKPLGNLVTGIYIWLGTQEELPAEMPTPPYRVSMFLAFEPGEEPLDSAKKAHAAADAIADAFGSRCFDKKTEQWNWIELKDCVDISEDELTVSQAKRLQQLPLEYLSLRSDPQGATPLGVRNA